MINSFDADIALDVGMAAAVLYKNIQYWCEKNRANGMNEHDGYFWTYNSQKAFRDLFPYLSEKTIRRSLEKLEENGYIKVGCFNEDARDRTKWYADLRPIKNNKEEVKKEDSNLPKGQMDTAKRADTNSQKGEALPNNYQITTTNNKNERMNESSKGKPARENTRASFQEILESVPVIKENPDLMSTFWEFIKHRERKKKPLTDHALKLNINKAFEKGRGDPKQMIERINETIEHGWDTIYDEKIPTAPQARRAPAQGVNPYTELKKKFLEEGHL